MRNYGVLKLTNTSPAQTFIEPMTLGDAKEFLRVDGDHSDTLITGFIRAAREAAEKHQGRDLVRKQYDLTLDSWPGELELRDNLESVDLIQWRDAAGVISPVTEYVVDYARGVLTPPLGQMWPISAALYPSGSILVRYTVAGMSQIPEMVIVGMKMLMYSWYDNPNPFADSRSVNARDPMERIIELLSDGGKRIQG